MLLMCENPMHDVSVKNDAQMEECEVGELEIIGRVTWYSRRMRL